MKKYTAKDIIKNPQKLLASSFLANVRIKAWALHKHHLLLVQVSFLREVSVEGSEFSRERGKAVVSLA